MISVRPAPFSATVLKSRDPRLSDTKQTQADILLRRRYLSIIRHFFLTAPSSSPHACLRLAIQYPL